MVIFQSFKIWFLTRSLKSYETAYQAELSGLKVRDDHVYIAAVSNIGRLLIFKIDELPYCKR